MKFTEFINEKEGSENKKFKTVNIKIEVPDGRFCAKLDGGKYNPICKYFS